MSQTLLRGLDLIEEVGRSGPMTVTELSRRTGIHITIVSRTIKACEPEGWLVRVDGKVLPGPRSALLGLTSPVEPDDRRGRAAGPGARRGHRPRRLGRRPGRARGDAALTPSGRREPPTSPAPSAASRSTCWRPGERSPPSCRRSASTRSCRPSPIPGAEQLLASLQEVGRRSPPTWRASAPTATGRRAAAHPRRARGRARRDPRRRLRPRPRRDPSQHPLHRGALADRHPARLARLLRRPREDRGRGRADRSDPARRRQAGSDRPGRLRRRRRRRSPSS